MSKGGEITKTHEETGGTEKQQQEISEEKKIEKPDPDLDGGFGWVVVFSGFILTFMGTPRYFGVIYPDLLTYFGAGQATTAWIGSLMYFMSNSPGLIVGPLSTTYGSRPIALIGAFLSVLGYLTSSLAGSVYVLMLTLGVMTGLGACMMKMAAMICMQYYFDKKRATATGFVVSGTGLGIMIGAPLLRYLEDTLSWRGALFLWGAVLMHAFPCAQLLMPKRKKTPRLKEDITASQHVLTEGRSCRSEPDRHNLHEESIETRLVASEPAHSYGSVVRANQQSAYQQLDDVDNGETWLERLDAKTPKWLKLRILSRMSTILISLSCFGQFFCMTTVLHFIPHHAMLLGFTGLQGSLLVSINGLTDMMARLLLGRFADRSATIRLVMYITSSIGCGVLTALLPLFRSYALLVVYSIIAGMLLGNVIFLTPVLTIDYSGVENMGYTMGVVYFFRGIASVMAPPLLGWLAGKTGSYNLSFMIAGIVFASFSSFLLLLVQSHIRRFLSR